jgi:hypothetical protein
MQTSFMHPPFGFALFYLRSVAPAKEYVDKLTGKLTPPITTGQIYWGAVPFVVIQCIMVGILIAFPGLVTGNLHKLTVDPSKMEIIIPESDYDRQESGPAPDFGTPSDEETGDRSGNGSDASDLERAFGGDAGSEAPAGGGEGAKDDAGSTDLEKAFLE